MRFDEWYYEYKKEGRKDEEIAQMIGVCTSTLKRMKNMYGIESVKRIRNNSQGLTEEQLRIADEKGISRRIALRRVREYGWDVEDAIHTPKGLWSGNYGKSKQEKRLEQSERQREYYKEMKRKVLRG